MESFNTGVVIHEGASEVLAILTPAWIESGSRFLQCRLISSEGPYLHVEVRFLSDTSVTGEILIPHNVVSLVITNASDKTLGFVRAAR